MLGAKHRILFLITTSDWGGAQFFVHALAKAAKEEGHSVIVAAGGEGELGSRCTQDGIHFEPLTTMRRELSPLHDLAAIHEIRTIIKDFKPDIVHLNSSKMGVVGSIAASLDHIPLVIYRIGGWSFLEDIPTWKKSLYLWSEKWTARNKDIVVTVHPGDEAEAKGRRILPKERLTTISNGIDLSALDTRVKNRADARRALGLADDAFVIGTLANFYPPKNIPWYLDAIAPLLRDGKAIATIIGNGPERHMIEEASQKLNLGRSLSLPGRLPDAASLLSAFDLFVLPSSKEGMPWSLLEAMAAGLPCIATDVGACRWMLEQDAGIIVPPNDADAMRSAITSLINDPARRATLGANARRAVETRFRWEDTLRASLALFDN
ncbi:MAG: glycosyltransferase family 4 protein [Patescibacteria group bacterium]